MCSWVMVTCRSMEGVLLGDDEGVLLGDDEGVCVLLGNGDLASISLPVHRT